MQIVACSTSRRDPDASPTYRGGIDALLDARCAPCHADPAPAAGWRADTYTGAIGCTASGAPAATTAPDAPILAALDRPDHAGIVSAEERATLARWLAAGAPSVGAGVHTAGFADPRSPESHGRFLRSRRYRPMTDPNDRDACGHCHEEAPVRTEPVRSAAPGATACGTCHTDQGAALACSTCHGAEGRAYPPRDRCFFPEEREDTAHAAHAAPSPSRATGLACTACHPTPALGELGGTHANGHVEVWFDRAIAGRTAQFDAEAKRCTGTCHARGGERPEPVWTDTREATCNDCHLSPPPDHQGLYAGPCTGCHAEANADGTALTSPTLHVNGRVDLGDGSGLCGACHGSGDNPWPQTGAHAVHFQPAAARGVTCGTCHLVPLPGERHPEGRGAAAVRLAGLAVRGGRRATFDPATKSCAGTYCHEGSGAEVPAPRWSDGPSASACGACHGTPPPPPHPASSACASCHPVDPDRHIDGRIDR
jgi:predicted CxxxxCH...CXXCH cytochrome family protein